jgi:ABC-2 type transport system permease protein
MTPWRLELLRLWRTRRLIALLAAYLVLGLGIPILTHDLPSLLSHDSGRLKVIAPPPRPADALTGFASNTSSLGTLVLVIVAAASVAVDARPALAAFYRSRVRRTWMLLVPRCLTVACAAVFSLFLGLICVWYETGVLIGPLRFAALVAGFGVEVLWICFCVSVVALWAGIARGVMPVIGATLASLLALVFLGGLHPVAPWLPTGIASGAAAFVGPAPGLPWRASLVAAVATIVFGCAATRLLARRSG